MTDNIYIALIVGAVSVYGLIREYLQYEKCKACLADKEMRAVRSGVER